MKRAFKDQTGKIVVIEGDLPPIARVTKKQEVVNLQLITTRTELTDKEYEAEVEEQVQKFLNSVLANNGSFGDKTLWEEIDPESVVLTQDEAAPADITLTELLAENRTRT